MKIRLEGVCKSFGAQAVLRGVSLEVEFGHTLALVGPSGGGKSTLLRLIAGLEAADAGRIFLNGVALPADGEGLRRHRARTGIVFQAFSLTIAALFAMLFIYKSGIIKVNGRFRMMVVMATGAIALVYLTSFVLSFFGIQIPYLHQGGPIGIGISAVVLAIACLNLLLDFDNFERGEQYGAPKYMEWFSAVGLIVTLVWIYLEILRLLSRLRD